LFWKTHETEAIARKLAAAQGVSVEEVVRESLVSPAGRRGIAANDRPLLGRLAALAREVDAIPPSADRRTTDVERTVTLYRKRLRADRC
jgi:hypothetical protein